jgi:hypothetical protein
MINFIARCPGKLARHTRWRQLRCATAPVAQPDRATDF